MRIALPLLFLLLLAVGSTQAQAPDSTKYTILSPDSLSEEDLALLEE